MFHTIICYLLLLNFIHINSEYFLNYCYKIFGYFQLNINIPIYYRMPFVPDVIKLTTFLKEFTFDSEIGIVRNESYILMKADYQCTENFVYLVPSSSYPILSLIIGVYWGPNDFLLDSQEVIMKKDFIDGRYVLQGTKEIILMPVFLKHQLMSFFQLPQLQVNPIPEYNKKIRGRLPQESYCMTFFSREITGCLVFSQLFSTFQRISEFYVFSINTYTNRRDPISSTRFLVKIFPCRIPIGFDQKFKIFVDPMTNIIEIELTDNILITYYIKNMLMSQGTAVDGHGRLPFDFLNLEVKIEPVTQEMVDQNVGILLYPSEPFLKYCEARIPENIDQLKFALVYIQLANNVVLKKIVRAINMATTELKVYDVRPGTQMEYEKCLA